MKYVLTLNNKQYEVEVELANPMPIEEYNRYAPATAPAAAPAVVDLPAPVAAPAVVSDGEAVTAPMPGTILKVNVSVGQTVKEGDVLCILEAMKMENEIMAPKNGVIKQVLTSKGSSVDTGAPLVVLA
jgi:biotin carboxyl carrier protein